VNSLRFRPTAPHWTLGLQDGTVLEADAVCLALASHQSANLLEEVDNSLAKRLRQIRYASTATVNLAYRREDVPHKLDGFGFVVPAIEKLEILACTFSHVKFERRAPQNYALLRTFVGGALQPEVFEYDDERMIRITRACLNRLLGISREPIFSQIERHPRAMAQYQVGHLELLAQIESRVQKLPTLVLAGNAFTGVGIPDCIHRGEVCADRLMTELAKTAVG
jgi:protoporphyrinogen/coproporphyrinogen III oxidase